MESKIVIDIMADNKNPTISFSGTGIQEATPRDIRQLFFIDDTIIKEYISAYFNNTKPRKVIYSSSSPRSSTKRRRRHSQNGPTSVHKRFNWNPVVLVSSVKSARTKDIHEGPSIFLYRRFKNPTNNTKIVNAGIEMPVAMTLETTWSTPFSERDFETDHDFVYDINVNFNENSGTTGITHTTTLGEPSLIHEHVTIGRSKYEVELKPGKTAVAKFSAKVCNLAMKAVIVTSVSGNLAVNFKEAVNGRHWWGPKVEDVLKHARSSTESPLEEHLVIRLDYYFDAKVEIFDKETGLPL